MSFSTRFVVYSLVLAIIIIIGYYWFSQTLEINEQIRQNYEQSADHLIELQRQALQQQRQSNGRTEPINGQSNSDSLSNGSGQLIGAGIADSQVNKVANASVTGQILSDQQWSGTITITGDVFILPGVKVEVLPGTIVRFLVQDDQQSGGQYRDEYIADHNDPTGTYEYNQSHANITGTIIAFEATFTSAAEKPEYADWVNLDLGPGSRIYNSVIEYCHNCINIQAKDIIVSNSLVHHGLWSCLDDHGGGAIVNNTAHHCWHQCIGTKGDYGALIKGNTVYECNIGINIESTNVSIKDNIIYGYMNDDDPNLPEIVVVDNNQVLPWEYKSSGGTYNGQIIYPAINR